MATYHSPYRGEMGAPDKVTGNSDFPGDLVSHPYAAAKEPDGMHKGKPEAMIAYDGNEFFCRVDDLQGRSWNFRGLSVGALKSQIERVFPDSRGRLRFRLSSAAHLAKDGEKFAIAKV
jgi:hypothetical protein